MAKKKSNSGFNKGRLLLVVAVIMTVMTGLFGRIIWIQVVNGEEFTKAVQAQQGAQLDSTIDALRGTIYDRNHNVLAQSQRVYDVIIDPKALQAEDSLVQQSTIQALAKLLKIKDTSVLEKYLTEEYADSQYERFSAGRNISESMKALIEEKMDSGDIAGVWHEEIQSRVYPNGELAAHVIGFNGVYGIEGQYDETLSGTAGRKMVVSAGDGEYREEVVDAQNGYSLVLTLDQTVQYYLEEALLKAMQDEECLNACGVIMNPQTGEVYAMAVYPTFNLNDVEKVIGLTSKYTTEMMSSEDFLPGIWTNFAVSGTYQPGSTYKPIFAAAALDCGNISAYDTFTCNASYAYYDSVFKCAYYTAQGTQS
ncbi:MAG: hypothetical protein IJ315_02010, partial [Firmicutes bacterium]|nr:hypothetical protein [Bacillota bacterium]